MKLYNTIIIGAGIAGASMAHILTQKNQKVLVVDRSSYPASGGSGAAGAFVSPKIGKGSPLQDLTNKAFEFSRDFYLKNFPEHFYQTGVVRMPKDKDDASKFAEYEKYNNTPCKYISSNELDTLGIRQNSDSFLFEDAGVCDAPAMCVAMIDGIDFLQANVERLERVNGLWIVDGRKASNLVLATGYESNMVDMRYMGIRGTWGSRGDYYSSLELNVSMHQKISISANIDGVVKIGATHVKSKYPCMTCNGNPLVALEEQASGMIHDYDLELKETFCGMRSGSKDYFPLSGKVIDVDYMLDKYPEVLRGAKPPLKYLENLYVCNGLGGRGFVFAPYVANKLAESILSDIDTETSINPDRLFLRWARRIKE